MKERALRRHQDFKAKKKAVDAYNSCIEDLSYDKRLKLENNVEKLKKICSLNAIVRDPKKINKKPLQVLKHDITMKEQMN